MYNNGTLNRNDCDYSKGVRPFWWIARASKQYAERRTTSSKEHITFPNKKDKYKGLNKILTDFQKVVDFGNLYRAYKKAKKGKRNKRSVVKFAIVALEGIHLLRELLTKRTYTISSYGEFTIFEPKERLVKSGAFKDKVVQHSLCDNVLLPTMAELFIENNFAGQIGKEHYSDWII